MNGQIKKAGKKIFSIIGATQLMNELDFRFQQIRHSKNNRIFKKNLKRFVFPKDRALFNTFQLNYKKYYEDGRLAANEMISWGALSKLTNPVVLDWGCGTGRVIRHIQSFKPSAICYGADIDCETLDWCRKNIDHVYFDCIHHQSLPYPSSYFDLVYGISVLTHIEKNEYLTWLKELNRILTPSGKAILSTHGTHYVNQLNRKEKKQLDLEGVFTNSYNERGHRLMTTYFDADFLKEQLLPYFDIEQFWEGKLHPEKMGGQDVWVLKQKIPATNGNRD